MPSRNRRNSSPCSTYKAATMDESRWHSLSGGNSSAKGSLSGFCTHELLPKGAKRSLTELDALWRGIIGGGNAVRHKHLSPKYLQQNCEPVVAGAVATARAFCRLLGLSDIHALKRNPMQSSRRYSAQRVLVC